MTFNKAALAIDGALINSALVRTEAFHNSSGEEGITQKGDLKVSQLAVAGNGLRISEGSGLAINLYQPNPNQAYTVTNPGIHTVQSASMPAANPNPQTYIVCVAIGDPEFDQAGHPFMLSTDPPLGQEADFEYVRAVVVSEANFNARTWPAIRLARLAIPANTTTITDAMITDLRKLARPRTRLEIAHVPGPGAANPLNGAGGTPGDYERWPDVSLLTVDVPSWAVKAKVIGFVEGVKLTKAGTGKLRAYVEGAAGLTTSLTNLDENDPGAGGDRRSYNFAGELNVTSLQGTNRTFSVQATPNNTASKGAWTTDSNTSVAIQVYFEEQPT